MYVCLINTDIKNKPKRYLILKYIKAKETLPEVQQLQVAQEAQTFLGTPMGKRRKFNQRRNINS